MSHSVSKLIQMDYSSKLSYPLGHSPETEKVVEGIRYERRFKIETSQSVTYKGEVSLYLWLTGC